MIENGIKCKPDRYCSLLPEPFKQTQISEKSKLIIELISIGQEKKLISILDLFSDSDFFNCISEILSIGKIEIVKLTYQFFF